MEIAQRMILDPDILVGKPIIKGTRISVELVIGLLAEGWNEEQIINNYDLSNDDILACLKYASNIIHKR